MPRELLLGEAVAGGQSAARPVVPMDLLRHADGQSVDQPVVPMDPLRHDSVPRARTPQLYNGTAPRLHMVGCGYSMQECVARMRMLRYKRLRMRECVRQKRTLPYLAARAL